MSSGDVLPIYAMMRRETSPLKRTPAISDVAFRGTSNAYFSSSAFACIFEFYVAFARFGRDFTYLIFLNNHD